MEDCGSITKLVKGCILVLCVFEYISHTPCALAASEREKNKRKSFKVLHEDSIRLYYSPITAGKMSGMCQMFTVINYWYHRREKNE